MVEKRDWHSVCVCLYHYIQLIDSSIYPSNFRSKGWLIRAIRRLERGKKVIIYEVFLPFFQIELGEHSHFLFSERSYAVMTSFDGLRSHFSTSFRPKSNILTFVTTVTTGGSGYPYFSSYSLFSCAILLAHHHQVFLPSPCAFFEM